MNHILVQSSNIKSIAHEGDTLQVAFLNGKTYEYPNVPKSVYDQMLISDSVGKFFSSHIRSQYPATPLN